MPHIWIPGIDDVEKDLAQYKDAKHEAHPHGLIFVNGREVAATLQCPHCGGHFVSRKGSGHRRTFCLRCKAVTCGAHACDSCRPWVDGISLFGREL